MALPESLAALTCVGRCYRTLSRADWLNGVLKMKSSSAKMNKICATEQLVNKLAPLSEALPACSVWTVTFPWVASTGYDKTTARRDRALNQRH